MALAQDIEATKRDGAAVSAAAWRPRLVRLAGLLADWWRIGADERYLASLNDRYLRDIGLSRPDIERERLPSLWLR